MKSIEKYNPFKSKTLIQIFLFLTVITVCLGDFIDIFGLKLSWIFAIFSIMTFIYEYIRKRYRIPQGVMNLKIIYGFFVFWLAYATVQLLIIDKNANALLFYRSLAIDIFLVLMLFLNTKSLDDVVFFNKALIIGYAANLMIVVWELCTGKPVGNEPVELGYVYSVFVNMNDLCTLVAFGVFALILNMLLTKKNILISIAAILFSVYIIIYDDARAPLLSLVLLLIFWGLFKIALLLRKKSRNLFIGYIAGMVAVPLIAAGILFSMYSITELVNMFSSDLYVTSDNIRVELARKAFEITKDSTFLGVGPGQSVQIIGVNVHNFFLEILSEYGIIILAGIVYLFVYIFTAFRTKLPNRVSSFLMAFIPFFAVVSISSSSSARIKATWVILTLVLLAVAYGGKEAKETAEASRQAEEL
jgi:teichuronic acid biosynthesis protein TuaE